MSKFRYKTMQQHPMVILQTKFPFLLSIWILLLSPSVGFSQDSVMEQKTTSEIANYEARLQAATLEHQRLENIKLKNEIEKKWPSTEGWIKAVATGVTLGLILLGYVHFIGKPLYEREHEKARLDVQINERRNELERLTNEIQRNQLEADRTTLLRQNEQTQKELGRLAAEIEAATRSFQDMLMETEEEWALNLPSEQDAGTTVSLLRSRIGSLMEVTKEYRESALVLNAALSAERLKETKVIIRYSNPRSSDARKIKEELQKLGVGKIEEIFEETRNEANEIWYNADKNIGMALKLKEVLRNIENLGLQPRSDLPKDEIWISLSYFEGV